MNYFNHKNVQLAYEAVYNQDLCESMEDLGLIDGYDSLKGNHTKVSKEVKEEKQEIDLYNIILEYLIQEGYADTLGSAEIILENMSEEWIEDILLEKEGYGDDSKFKGDTDASSFRPGKDVPPVKKYGRLSRFAPSPLSGERSRTSSYVRRTVGDSPNQPRAVQMPAERKPRRVIPSRLDRK